MLIVAGVLAAVVAVVVIVTSLGGGSSSSKGTTTAATSTGTGTTTHSTTHRKASSKTKSSSGAQATNPAEASVAVLNGTETTGLAHRISSDLQQRGYSQATPLGGRPPGTSQVTVVEYAAGHQADAEGVARSLSVAKVQPMEATVASLVASAKVVVIVGADKATGP